MEALKENQRVIHQISDNHRVIYEKKINGFHIFEVGKSNLIDIFKYNFSRKKEKKSTNILLSILRFPFVLVGIIALIPAILVVQSLNWILKIFKAKKTPFKFECYLKDNILFINRRLSNGNDFGSDVNINIDNISSMWLQINKINGIENSHILKISYVNNKELTILTIPKAPPSDLHQIIFEILFDEITQRNPNIKWSSDEVK